MKIYGQLLIFLLLVNSFLMAADYRGGNALRLNPSDTLHSDLIGAGRYVDILGTLKSDIYTACESFSLEGRVADDALVAARKITIRGEVGDMVLALGQNILIDGEVGGDLLAFGAEVRLTPRAHVRGNVQVGSGMFRMEGGKVGGWIRGGAGNIYLNGEVGKKVDLEVESVSFGPDYRASAGTKLTLPDTPDQANLGYPPDNLEISVKEKKTFLQSGYFYWSLLAMFVTGLILGMIFKKETRALLERSANNLLSSLGIGFLVVFAVPLIIIILLLLILTIPLAFILLACYLVLLYLGIIFSGLWLGDYLFSLIRKDRATLNLVVPFAAGLVILVLTFKVPYLGFMMKLLAVCLGSGSMVLYLRSCRTGESLTKKRIV